MKTNRTFHIRLLQAGTCLLPAGPAVFLAGLPWTGTALYAAGVVMLSLLQQATERPLTTLPSHVRVQVKRLRAQVSLATLALAASAVLMGLMTWDMTHATYRFPWTHHNAWLVFCLIGAVVLLYANLRLDHIRRHTPLVAVLLSLGLATSCSEQSLVQNYELRGRTSFIGMEDRVLTLKVFEDSMLVDIDSARVTHGKFTFRGTADSAVMANLFVGDVSIIPIVIEEGLLTIKLYEADQEVGGTPLNDSLDHFIHRKTQLDNQLFELPDHGTRLILEGNNADEVARMLTQEARALQEEHDHLVVNFIRRNHTNPLGPGIFMIMTSALPYPTLLHPRVEEVVNGAPEKFLSNSYVNWYLKRARSNDETIRKARENK